MTINNYLTINWPKSSFDDVSYIHMLSHFCNGFTRMVIALKIMQIFLTSTSSGAMKHGYFVNIIFSLIVITLPLITSVHMNALKPIPNIEQMEFRKNHLCFDNVIYVDSNCEHFCVEFVIDNYFIWKNNANFWWNQI